MSGYPQSRVDHCKMNCMGGNDSHIDGTDSRSINPAHVHPDQSHLMALTSEWGHSVFELHGPRENVGYNLMKHPAPFPYKPSLHTQHNVGGMMHSTEPPPYMSSMYGHKPDSHSNYTIPEPQCNLQEEIKQEEEERNFNSGYVTPKDGGPPPENKPEKDGQFNSNPELPKADEFHPKTSEFHPKTSEFHSKTSEFHRGEEEEESRPESSSEGPSSPLSIDRTLRLNLKESKLSSEEIMARRSALAASQRDVRKRRKEKMSEEEIQEKLSKMASNQREARKKQREKMTEEELQLRRTISALTQREIRRRRMSNMTEEELKVYRAREASRQKELRYKRRSEMTEEELKLFKAREAAASAARRARHLGLDRDFKKSHFLGEEPDPSPS